MRDWRTVAAEVITAGAVIVFVATLAHATLFSPETELSEPTLAAAAPANKAQPGYLPSRLIIPSLSINANVQYVGIAYSGDIGVPNNFTDVAWYKYGTVPGFAGDAVIDGHVDNAVSLPGVFKHLGSLEVGADVYVQTEDGAQKHFTVTAMQIYQAGAVPMQQILATTSSAYLTLITCDGVWQQNERQYNERLVVTAQLVS